MKVGDLVKFKNIRPGQVFLVYKIYKDDGPSCAFLLSGQGKYGAYLANELKVISESR